MLKLRNPGGVDGQPARRSASTRRPRLGRLFAAAAALLMSAVAAAAPIVTYTFSGVDPALRFSGSVMFSAGMPLLPPLNDQDFFASYQPSAVVSLTMGDTTWSNAALPQAYCSVEIHVGWIQIGFWCRYLDGADLRDFRLDFISATGSNLDWEPDPTGPFAPDTLSGQRVYGYFETFDPDWHQVSLRLDAVRIDPYVAEPGLPALLAAGALAGLLARRRRRPDRLAGPQPA